MRCHTKDGLINFHYPDQLLIFLFIPLELSTSSFFFFTHTKTLQYLQICIDYFAFSLFRPKTSIICNVLCCKIIKLKISLGHGKARHKKKD